MACAPFRMNPSILSYVTTAPSAPDVWVQVSVGSGRASQWSLSRLGGIKPCRLHASAFAKSAQPSLLKPRKVGMPLHCRCPPRGDTSLPHPWDSVKVGSLTFQVAGTLRQRSILRDAQRQEDEEHGSQQPPLDCRRLLLQ